MEFFIGELIWEGKEKYGVEVLRCKGVFYDQGQKAYMLQGVQDLFEFRDIDQKDLKPKFLFVTRGELDSEKLKADMIKACC